MQQVSKGATSDLIMTLKEKQTLASPYFLFQFICEGSNKEVVFIAADISGYTERFNKFSIIESATPNPTQGEVTLEEGIHEYRVYEQLSSTNLIVGNAYNQTPLEVGLVKVTGTPTDNFKTPTYNDTFKWKS
jgi:hypothetical protein